VSQRKLWIGSIVVVLFLLVVGAAFGRSVAQHRVGDASAARNATSSTHVLSRAQGHAVPASASRLASSPFGSSLSLFNGLRTTSPLLVSTGCGASGSIADQSGFEDADGNLNIDTAGCMDWNGFTPTWSGAPSTTAPQTGTASNNGFTFAGATDLVNSTSDNIFAGGVKQDTVCPGTVTGKANDKADLAAIYVAGERINGKVYLFLSWERQLDTTVNSDVFVSFEFDQSKVSCGAGSPFVQRTAGDLLIEYNFQSGNSTIDVQQWDGSTWVPLATPPFEASINNPTVTDTIRPDQPASLTQFEFGEAGIDLTGLDLTGNGGRACETFGSVLGGSRTSKSGSTAQLKDFVGPAPIDVSNCATPTVTTTQMPASGSMGDTFKDKATVSGAVTPDGTGSITFKLYSAADCGGSVLDTETVTGINANGDYTTPNGVQLNDAGTYYWVASFSGDNFNSEASSGCNDEPVTVAKASPSIVTTQMPASGAIGITYQDKATLSGGLNYKGTGSITFTLYSAADCGGSVLDTETVDNIAGNGDVTTPNGFAIQNAGTYYWVASFSGDANNNSFTSGCNDEPVVVAKNQPSIVTTQMPASGAIGDTYNDKATLSDGVNYTGTGTINFKLYSASDCGGSVLDNENVTPINGNGDFTTPNGFAIQNAGTYYWVASFNGDANNKSFTSGCNDEPVVVAKASPSIVTTQLPANGGIGVLYKDTATLSGAKSLKGTGSITFKLYDAADCDGSVLDTETVSNISVNGDFTTPNGFTIENTGTYYWVASFNGDANNNSFTSGCNDEPVVVVKNQPSIVTTPQPASGSVDDVFGDKATLSGGANYDGTGSITFKLYSAADCGGSVVDTETVPNISANGDVTTPNGFAIPSAGTFYWVASFSGDSNNGAFTSACNDEPVVVNPPDIHIVKTADATQVNAGDQIGFTLTVYNDGAGNAYGVNVNDVLPANDGLAWQIDSQGSGWGNGASQCAIVSGTLSCGPVTVPAGTTQAASTFTVHIISATTAATGVDSCEEGTGNVNNMGSVTTTNDGSDQSSAYVCVLAPDIHIVKTADATSVTAGDQIGFTLTVSNSGLGDAYGMKLTDVLPTNPGLDWTIESQGSGWGTGASQCAIAAGKLACGPVTVPAGTTPEESTFTVHIISPTTLDTGVVSCPEVGNVDNTGHVTTSNDGSDSSEASVCVQGLTDLQITKTGSPATQEVTKHPYGNITWTMVVKNNGPLPDTNVMVGDPIPAGNIYVSYQTTKGSCIEAANVLNCSLGTMQPGDTVTITLVTTPTITGQQVNTAQVVGDMPETNTDNNQATATVLVVGKLPPPPLCTSVLVKPKQLNVNQTATLHITVRRGVKVVQGVRVRITGPGILVITNKSNANGKITRKLTPKKIGILYFKPVASKACKVSRVGIAGVIHPTG
jgi:uncharacterized repeat protein (TIGR01451 family)